MKRRIIHLYEQYVPFLWSIAGINDEKLMKMVWSCMHDFFKAKGDQQISKFHCFFSHILAASMGNQFHRNLLSYVDSTIHHLYNSTRREIQQKIKSKVTESLLDISDHDALNVKNPAYINPLAELLLVDTFISRLPQDYKLQAMDACMGNGKDSDYLFVRQDDGCKIYMDVMSLHCIKPEKVDSVEGLYDFIADKINKKFDAKVKNLSLIHGNLYDINGESSEFHVVPILWAEVCDLLPYSEVFDQLQTNGISGMMYSLRPRKLENGSYTFSMELVSNIIEEWKYELSQM